MFHSHVFSFLFSSISCLVFYSRFFHSTVGVFWRERNESCSCVGLQCNLRFFQVQVRFGVVGFFDCLSLWPNTIALFVCDVGFSSLSYLSHSTGQISLNHSRPTNFSGHPHIFIWFVFKPISTFYFINNSFFYSRFGALPAAHTWRRWPNHYFDYSLLVKYTFFMSVSVCVCGSRQGNTWRTVGHVVLFLIYFQRRNFNSSRK